MAIITISRGTFSGGKAVAELLANRLGHRCLSREILIKKAAKEFSIPENRLSDAMAGPPGMLTGDVPVSITNVNYVRATLLKELKDCRLVYHGLAGDLLLHGIKKMLRVRIVASKEYRVNVLMENQGLDEKKAVALIDNLDRQRDRWATTVLGTQWDDPSLYDLALNLDSMPIDSAVNIICKMSSLAEFTPDETTETTLSNLKLRALIWAAITRHSATKALQISIEVNEGEVLLSGSVTSRKVADVVVSLTRNIDGVTSIHDEMQIGIPWLW